MSPEFIYSSLGISLLLTLVIELLFALCFRIRGKDLIIVGLVNVLTNPAVVVLYLLLCRYYCLWDAAVVIILEIIAFLTEALIYKTVCRSIKRPFLFAFGANAFSYLCGALIGVLL